MGSSRNDDVDLEMDELGRDLGGALGAPLRPAILNRDGAALDPAKLTQSLHQSSGPWMPSCSVRTQEPDGRQSARWLRPRPERPCGCRAAEQTDELAPFQLMETHPIPQGPGAHRRISGCSGTVSGLARRCPAAPHKRPLARLWESLQP